MMSQSKNSVSNSNLDSKESEDQQKSNLIQKSSQHQEGNSNFAVSKDLQETTVAREESRTGDSRQDQEDQTRSNISSRSTTPRPIYNVTQTPTSFYTATGQSFQQQHQHQPQIHQYQHQTPLQNHFDPYRESYRQHKTRRDSISIQSLIAVDPRSPSTYTNKAQLNYHRDYRISGDLTTKREMNFGLASHHIPSPNFDHGSIPRDDQGFHAQSNSTTTNLMVAAGDQYGQSPQSASSASFHSSSFGHHDNSSLLDQDSFAVLSSASKEASFGHTNEHGFDPYGTENTIGSVSPYDHMSRSSSGFSIHSGLSGSEISNPAHESGAQSDAQILEGQTTHEGMIIGRTRSGTVRRYHSLSSSLSAPQRGEESVSVSPTGSNISLRTSSDRGRGSSTTSSIAISDSTASSSMSRKKRNKCSPEQFRQLEAFFAKNRNPTGKVREELARSIRMPERSVQVWFQNKRAKTKMNEIKEGIPPILRTTISKPRTGQGSSSMLPSRSLESDTSNSSIMRGGKRSITQTSSSEESVIQLPVVSLCIGAWRRIKPLICLFSRRQQAFTWYLSSESVGFKLECPRTCVTRVIFSGPRAPTVHEFGEGINTQIGYLTIELDRPPQFYMEVFRSSGASPKGKDGQSGGEQETTQQKASWRQCSDFTEGKQATTIFQHVISGPYVDLRQAVMQLMESGGALSPLVEMRDEGFGSNSSTWSDAHFNQSSFHGHQSGLQSSEVSQLAATSQHPLYTYHPQGGYPISTTENSSVMNHGLDDSQFGASNQNQWSHASMPSNWTSSADFTNGTTAQFTTGGQQGHPMTAQGSQHGHLTIHPGSTHSAIGGGAPIVTPPPSASVLDMNNLRIDTSSMNSGNHTETGHPAFEDGINQSSYSPTWPRTASIQPSSSWTSSTSSEGMNESGFSSAPAFGFNSFQQQQQQQHVQAQQQPIQAQSSEQDSNASALMSHSSSQDGGNGQSTSMDANVAAAVAANELHRTMFNHSGTASATSSPIVTTFNHVAGAESVSSSSGVGRGGAISHSGQSTMDESVMDTSSLQLTSGEASNDTLRLHQSAL